MKIPYSTRLLTDPEANVRMGTAISRTWPRFGGIHFALARYNAGETAVRRWITERPGLTDREEFIDDIPYPETQNYVKRILRDCGRLSPALWRTRAACQVHPPLDGRSVDLTARAEATHFWFHGFRA